MFKGKTKKCTSDQQYLSTTHQAFLRQKIRQLFSGNYSTPVRTYCRVTACHRNLETSESWPKGREASRKLSSRKTAYR